MISFTLSLLWGPFKVYVLTGAGALHWVSPCTPPFFIAHGLADTASQVNNATSVAA